MLKGRMDEKKRKEKKRFRSGEFPSPDFPIQTFRRSATDIIKSSRVATSENILYIGNW